MHTTGVFKVWHCATVFRAYKWNQLTGIKNNAELAISSFCLQFLFAVYIWIYRQLSLEYVDMKENLNMFFFKQVLLL